MSLARNLLRNTVLRTNSIFPFSWLNRAAYRLALRAFVRLCEAMPEIRGVYLRHGMAGSDWVPGLSDIDLTVTFSAELSVEEEFQFLTRFWTKFASLRRLFPMLADVTAVSQDQLPAWSRFGTWGMESPYWQVLSGGQPACAYLEAGAARDAIDDALYRYFECLLAWYFESDSLLRLKRMQRVASRIFRYAPLRPVQTDDAALLVARVLLGLDRWLDQAVRESGQAPYTGDRVDQESVMVHRDTCIAIPGGRQDEESLRETLLRMRQNPPSAGRIRVATFPVVRYWFRESNPRQHCDWILDSQLLRGIDFIARIEPPDEQACVQNLLSWTSLILDFPRQERLVLQSMPRWFAGEAYRSMAERGWYLKLYLEKGVQTPQYGRTLREIHRHYPAAVKELAEIQTLAFTPGCNLPDLRLRAFRLLRETAFDVNQALTEPRASASGNEKPFAAATL